MTHINVIKLTDLPWIIDSATNHMVSTLDVLHNVQTVRPDQNTKVHLPNRGVTFVTHMGNCNFTDIGELHDVLYVPEFKYNLLSVAKVTKELNCFVSFYPGFCVFQDLSSGKLKGIGKEENGLYFLVQSSCYNTKVPVNDIIKGFVA